MDVCEKYLTYLSSGKRDINTFMIQENVYGLEIREMLETIKKAYLANPAFLMKGERNEQ